LKELATLLRDLGFAGGLLEGEPLSRHCSLGVGGAAALYAVAGDERDLQILCRSLDRSGAPWMVAGAGTNLLFPDGGYPGCVVRLGGEFDRCEFAGAGVLEAGAGFATPGLVARASGEGLTGVEFAAGIPGTVGGALRMNAGTREGDMGRAVAEIQYLHQGRLLWRGRGDLAFAYRSLVLPREAVITRARFALAPDDPRTVRERVEMSRAGRKKTQPKEASAGCWFRNPPGDSAGRLIEAAGLKGLRVGGAEVSRVHANFLVRRGPATAEDFLSLARKVREGVADRFGVLLAEEVHVVHA